jgi:hypothetical protein
MLVFSAVDHMNDDQYARWRRLLDRLAVLEARHPGRYLFHGTSEYRALAIVKDGFEPKWVPTQGKDYRRDAKGVYWGCLDIARNFALRHNSDREGFPVIIVARTGDVVAAGTPHPDMVFLEGVYGDQIPEMSWQDSLRITGAMVSLDCRRVKNMTVAGSARPGEKLAPVDYATYHAKRIERMGLTAPIDEPTPAPAF